MVGGFTDDDCTGRGVCHSGLRCSGGVYSWAASRVGGLQEAKHEVRGRAYSDAVRRGALGARNGMARLAQLATGSVGIMSSELWRFGIKPYGDGGCADWRRRRNAHYQTLRSGCPRKGGDGWISYPITTPSPGGSAPSYQTLGCNGGGGLNLRRSPSGRQMRAIAAFPASDDGREWIRCLKCDQRFRVVPVSGCWRWVTCLWCGHQMYLC